MAAIEDTPTGKEVVIRRNIENKIYRKMENSQDTNMVFPAENKENDDEDNDDDDADDEE